MRWKFVEKELPEPFEPVLLWVEWSPMADPKRKNQECVTGHRTRDGYWVTTVLHPDRVIAWMPIPKPPKEKKKR